MCFVNVLNNKTEVNGTFLFRTGKIKKQVERTMYAVTVCNKQCQCGKKHSVKTIYHNININTQQVKSMNLNRVQNPTKVEP